MSKRYDNFRYLFPPRPETKAPSSSLSTYQGRFLGQPKLNGSCAVIFTNGKEVKIMNRHKDTFSRATMEKEDMLALHRGEGWLVLCGELMNKSQKDMNGKPLKGFVIFDVLVYNGDYLTGSTFIDRHNLLQKLYPGEAYDPFIDEVSNNVYRVNNFEDLATAYDQLVQVPMYEGLVLKKPKGKLQPGYSGKNNTLWQAKVRKPTKNYKW